MTLCDIEIAKIKVYCHKIPIFLEDVDTEEILVSNNFFWWISYDKHLFFLIENDDFLQKYNTIWDKISTEKNLKQTYLKHLFILKTEIKSYVDKLQIVMIKKFLRYTPVILVQLQLGCILLWMKMETIIHKHF